VGVVLLSVICTAAFFGGAKGLVAVNTAITPVMVVGILFLGGYAFLSSVPVFSYQNIVENAVVSSFLYVSYNSLALIMVMTALRKYIDSRRTGILAAALGSGTLCAVAAVLWLLLRRFDAPNAEMPVLSILGGIGQTGSIIYFFVLYIAIVTTAVANGFGVMQSLGVNARHFGILLCAAGACVSFAGFSTLVMKGYAFFGYIGMPVAAITLVDGMKYMKNRDNL
jgi:uncharacterized membrane protein YkvI